MTESQPSSVPSSVTRSAAASASAPKTERWLQIARGLLEQPTASLLEHLPLSFVRAFSAERPALSLEEDAVGNLVVSYRGPEAPRGSAPVLVAHLDHPGFAIDGVEDAVEGATATLSFRGGVASAHVHRGEPVRFHVVGQVEPTAEGRLVDVREQQGRLRGAVAEVVEGVAHLGGFATWAFPGFSLASPPASEPDLEGDTIVARACDDLLGAASVLCALDELASLRPPDAAVVGLFTRAEEMGFLGALEAIRLQTVAEEAPVVSVECSKALANAPQGEGPIVRVGDARTIFDPGLTERLEALASDAGIRHQRRLMDGGTCEASAFSVAGYRSSGLALPLGGYHNMDLDGDGRPVIGPETVRVADFEALVRLLVEVASRPGALEPVLDPPDWFSERSQAAREALAAPGVQPGSQAGSQPHRQTHGRR